MIDNWVKNFGSGRNFDTFQESFTGPYPHNFLEVLDCKKSWYLTILWGYKVRNLTLKSNRHHHCNSTSCAIQGLVFWHSCSQAHVMAKQVGPQEPLHDYAKGTETYYGYINLRDMYAFCSIMQDNPSSSIFSLSLSSSKWTELIPNAFTIWAHIIGPKYCAERVIHFPVLKKMYFKIGIYIVLHCVLHINEQKLKELSSAGFIITVLWNSLERS